MPHLIFYRSLLLLLGISILAFGVVLSIHSHLGTAPISSVPYTFSYLVPLSVGTLTILMHALFIVIQMLLLGRNFQWFQWSQLFMGIIFGFLIDGILNLTASWSFEFYATRLFISLMSCVLTAIGVCLMVKANLILLAGDGLYIAFVKRFGFNLGNCKTVGDCILVSISILSSYLVLHEVVGVREGTIITALLVGSIIRMIKPYFDLIQLDPPLKSSSDLQQ
ncbi:YczE/YyaS/YitT family protein [Acinetobacter shaoyimingii]|uniref:YitT family protein n=1 Tax=Acinetobacter shaoyimingii TaxID=2715164 RepID=A0A6G8RUZ6_9GAMM|nr:DUF6198 family protein [Acinetobacter shaoyimingii]QIO05744.1 YitT family protein [Acinetobacter shaoyimingii]